MRSRERDQRTAFFQRGKAPFDRAGAQLGVARLPGQDGDRVRGGGGDRDPEPPSDPGPPAPVPEPRLDRPAHRHLASEALDAPCELAARCKARLGQQHRIGDAHTASLGGERRLEHVGLWEVAALGGERQLRAEYEPPAAPGVEQRSEHARRVQVREAEPVDRASRATSAMVRPSPMAPYPRSGA
jgi:hypothetical protein